MLYSIIFCVCLCSRVLFVKSEVTDGNLTITIYTGNNCSIAAPTYRFIDGSNVTLVLNKNRHINHGWVRNRNSSKHEEWFLSNLTKTRTLTVDKSTEGIWEFKFLYLRGDPLSTESTRKLFNGENYTQLICSTNVIIEPGPMSQSNKYWIIGSVVGVIAAAIILAQTACIVKLRAKANSLNRLEHLSKKSEPTGNDSARYCSNPGQKMTKIVAPVDEDDSRESVIYEAPNIELPDRAPILPPQPPAIHTIPRTPRLDHNIRIEHQTRLAAAMNCPTQHPAFPRPTPSEVNMGKRDPLPLPPHNDVYEVYEEVYPVEENTYEPPPIMKTMPHKPSVPQKKIATAKLPDIQVDTVKLRNTGKKPVVTPKPQKPRSSHVAPVNELEMAFKRRNNVVQVPIKTIPSPSTSRGSSPKPKPPPVVITRPRGPPVPTTVPIPQPIEEETYYNDPRDSSDEEWTYEPLKPVKNYDTNIYNNVQ